MEMFSVVTFGFINLYYLRSFDFCVSSETEKLPDQGMSSLFRYNDSGFYFVDGFFFKMHFVGCSTLPFQALHTFTLSGRRSFSVGVFPTCRWIGCSASHGILLRCHLLRKLRALVFVQLISRMKRIVTGLSPFRDEIPAGIVGIEIAIFFF